MKDTMKAAVLHAPGDLRIEDVQIPRRTGPYEALIKVKYAGICGSDLDRIMRTGTYSFPCIPGHEFCGEIADIADRTKEYRIGDRVCVAPILPCMQCSSCVQGNYGQCDHYNYLGSRTNGCMAEYIVVPNCNLIKMPDNVSFKEGGAVEPAAVTLHGIIRAKISAGDTVVVLGCGAIGLFTVQLVKILGATDIIAVDIVDGKLEAAKKYGVTAIINSLKIDPVDAVKQFTGGRLADVVIETAGTSVTQEQCLRAARKHGRIVYLGTAHKDVMIPAKSFECIIRNELNITGSWNSYSAPFPGIEWNTILKYVSSGALDIDSAITHTIPLKDAPDTIARMEQRAFAFNKVVIKI